VDHAELRLVLQIGRPSDRHVQVSTECLYLDAELAGRGGHGRGVYEGSTRGDLRGLLPAQEALGAEDGLELVPTGIVAGRERLADPGWPMAEPDIAIAAAGVAELGEAPILLSLQERPAGRRRLVTHSSSASTAGVAAPPLRVAQAPRAAPNVLGAATLQRSAPGR
jgi:hypothetical protein